MVASPALRNTLLFCGIISSVLYLTTDIIAVHIWDSYDVNSQTVSELFAIDAPSAFIVVPMFITYSVLVFFYGAGIWLSAGEKKSLKVAALLITGKEVIGLVGTIFTPIHLRGVPATGSDVWHGIITGAGVLLFMFPAMAFGAAAFGKKFRIYSILTMIAFIAFGTLSGLMGEALAKNEPTPWMGVYERINIYGYMLWIIIFTLKLLKTTSVSSPTNK